MGGSVNNTKAGIGAVAKTITLDGAERHIASTSLPVSAGSVASLAAAGTTITKFDLGADYDQFDSVVIMIDAGQASPGAQINSVFGGDSLAIAKYPMLDLLTNKVNAPVVCDTVANRYISCKCAVVSRYVLVSVTAGSAAFTASAFSYACPGQ